MLDHEWTIWAGLAVIALWPLVAFILYWRESRRRERFDKTILDAINHVMDSPHSYTRSDWAERKAFDELHKAMCSGDLPSMGREGDFTAPRRISARECSRLEPREVGVPRTPAAPDGVRFVLAVPLTGRPEQDEARLTLSDLRIRSRDLYRVWPKSENTHSESSGSQAGS